MSLQSHRTAPGKRSNGQLPWTEFFSQELHLERGTESSTIVQHVYLSPPNGSGPLFVTHHGAGCSGLSFAAFAAEVRKILPSAGVLSPDARGHGGTVVHSKTQLSGSESDSMLDFGLQVLSNDLLETIRLVREAMEWKTLPNLILVGHSLGGAVITDLASGGELGDKVLAYAVLDVVEGTALIVELGRYETMAIDVLLGSAMDALQHFQTHISSRPSSFKSIDAAVEWQYVELS